MRKPIVCIITGPCGAGKSTIARSLAEEMKRSAYVNADVLRNDFVKNGYVSPASNKSDKDEVRRQIELSTKNVSDITINFLKAGFNVFIDDVLENKKEVLNYNKYLKGFNLNIFLLLPDKKALAKRDRFRKKECIMGKRALELHDIFIKKLPEENWHVLDTSNHSVNETKNEILNILEGLK